MEEFNFINFAQISKRRYSIENFFKKNNIKLKMKYVFPDDISDIRDFIITNIKKNNDLIVCFDYNKLYGSEEWGHVSLIQSIDKNDVILIDPWKNAPDKRKVKLKNLLAAMKYHGRDKRGGFWIIYKK